MHTRENGCDPCKLQQFTAVEWSGHSMPLISAFSLKTKLHSNDWRGGLPAEIGNLKREREIISKFDLNINALGIMDGYEIALSIRTLFSSNTILFICFIFLSFFVRQQYLSPRNLRRIVYEFWTNQEHKLSHKCSLPSSSQTTSQDIQYCDQSIAYTMNNP